MFNIHDITRDEMMLKGTLKRKGYDWWWHSFTGVNKRTGKEKAFFIEYFLCNPAKSKSYPVLGQKPENKKKHVRPSYMMVKAGSWGKGKARLHRFFSWDDICVKGNAPYAVMADDCYASETRLIGSVKVSREEAKAHPEYMSDEGSMSWDLKVRKEITFNVGYGASKFFRKIEAFEMYWHAEGMKTCYEGTVIYNGEEYEVSFNKSYGYADKNWGRDFTSPWVWLSSNCMRSRLTGEQLTNSVFDIGGGCPKVYFVPLKRKLLGGFFYEGKEYEFNFSKFWMMPRTVFKFKEDENFVYWYVKQSNFKSIMVTVVKCDKKDMLLVNYESPDGEKRHNMLWNGGTGVGRVRFYKKTLRGPKLIDDIDVTHIGCEYGEYDSVAAKEERNKKYRDKIEEGFNQIAEGKGIEHELSE